MTNDFKPINKIQLSGGVYSGRNLSWGSHNSLAVITKRSLMIAGTSKLDHSTLKNSGNNTCIFALKTVDRIKSFQDFDDKFENLCEMNFQHKLRASTDISPVDAMQLRQCPYNMFHNQKNEKRFFRSVHNFMCSHCGNQYVMVLSDCNRLLMWRKGDAKYTNWEVAFNLTTELRNYWSDLSPTAKKDMELDKSSLEKLCITSMSWLDFTPFFKERTTPFKENSDCGVICTGTESGHLVLWTIKTTSKGKSYLSVMHVLNGENGPISSANILSGKNVRDSLSICVSFLNGRISVFNLQYNSMNKELLWSKPFLVWEEADLLKVNQLTWIEFTAVESTVMVFAKGNAIVCLKIHSGRRVVDKLVNTNMHFFDIVFIRALRADEQKKEIAIMTASLDGHITNSCVRYDRSLSLMEFQVISHFDDFGALANKNKLILVGAEISPNGVFLATLTSTYSSNRTICEDAETFLSIYIIKNQSNLIRNLVESGDSPCHNSDWLILLQLKYPEHRAQVDNFCSKPLPLQCFPVLKRRHLQYIWHFRYAKIPSSVRQKKQTLSSDLDQIHAAKKQLFAVSAVAFLRSLVDGNIFSEEKLTTACDYLSSVQTIINWLEGDKSLVDVVDTLLLRSIKDNPVYPSLLPTAPKCMFLDTPLQLSYDKWRYVEDSNGGSDWPVCCLTFIPIQSHARRLCPSCDVFSLPITDIYPSWFKDILLSPCPLCDGHLV